MRIRYKPTRQSIPTLQEKYAYTRTYKNWYLCCGFVSLLFLSCGFFMFSASHFLFYAFFPFFLFSFVYLLISYVIGFTGEHFNVREYRKILQHKGNESVDVYLPVCNENLDVIRETWTNVKNLTYPNLKVYVLDDGKSDDVKAMAAEFRFNYLRREGNKFKKAGNLLNAFGQTGGEFILVLDADFCPRPEMLNFMLPIMRANASAAIVQTPQYFDAHPSLNAIERGSGVIQELFYRLIQQNRNTFGASICVGTCALYRRSALEKIGGFRQIEHSEDVWTGFTLKKSGFDICYLPLNLSKGRCPDNWRAYVHQQYRWCYGSLSLATSKEFWKSPLGIIQKICYLSGMMYYSATALQSILMPLPALLMLWIFPHKILWHHVFLVVPSLLFGTLAHAAWSHYPYELHYMRTRIVSYYTHLLAIKDKLLGKVEGWQPTGAVVKNKRSQYQTVKKMMLAANCSILCIFVVGIYTNLTHGIAWYNLVPTTCLVFFQMYLNVKTLKEFL